jgi:hypothetical protein
MSERMTRDGAHEQLGKLLNECGMEVTFTGWKAELEACEKRCAELESILKDLGPWASAALSDASVCKELKDIFQRVVDKIGEGE